MLKKISNRIRADFFTLSFWNFGQFGIDAEVCTTWIWQSIVEA